MENKQSNIEIDYAEFFDRAIAHIIDQIILFAANFVFLLSVNLVTKADFSSSASATLLTITIVFLYYGLMESSHYQATIGKLTLGLKVTNLILEKISFMKALERVFILQLPALLTLIFRFENPWGLVVCYLLIVMPVVFTTRKQGIHDKVAKCIIVKKESLEQHFAQSSTNVSDIEFNGAAEDNAI